MAFGRKSLKDMGLTDEQVDKVMTLHGTTMGDYIPKSQLADEISKATEGADIKALKEAAGKTADLEKQLSGLKYDYALNDSLKAKGVKGDKAIKAVRSLLDPEKIKFDDAGKLTGLDEQLDELSKDDSVKALFAQTDEPPAQPPKPGAPQFTAGQTQGTMPTGQRGPSFNDVWHFPGKK